MPLNCFSQLTKIAVAFFLILCIAACERPEEGIGLNVQPEEDLLNFLITDTTHLVAYTIRDTVRSDEVFNGMVGAYQDPVFGLVNAAIVGQLIFSANLPVFKNADSNFAVVDSVILSLSYLADTSFYGTITPQNFRILELNNRLQLDSVYYNTTTPEYTLENLIDNLTPITPNPYDSVSINSDDLLTQIKLKPQIRIKLKNSVGEKIVQQHGLPTLTTDGFLDYFKGLYIGVYPTPIPSGDGMINLIDWNSNATRMTIYYNFPLDTINKSYPFYLSANSARYNFVTHDFYSAIPSLAEQVSINNPVILNGQTDLYMQAGGGTKLILKIPELDNYNSIPNLAVNKAELILPVKNGSDAIFEKPALLGVLALDENGNELLLPDQFTGTYDEAINAYRINISRFVQQVLYGNFKNYGLQIVTTNSAITPNRVQINGPDNILENKTKLVLYFTKY